MSTTPPVLLLARFSREAPDVKLVATDSIKRDMDYGLAFYRNQPMIHYDADGVPDAEHLLVIRAQTTPQTSIIGSPDASTSRSFSTTRKASKSIGSIAKPLSDPVSDPVLAYIALNPYLCKFL